MGRHFSFHLERTCITFLASSIELRDSKKKSSGHNVCLDVSRCLYICSCKYTNTYLSNQSSVTDNEYHFYFFLKFLLSSIKLFLSLSHYSVPILSVTFLFFSVGSFVHNLFLSWNNSTDKVLHTHTHTDFNHELLWNQKNWFSNVTFSEFECARSFGGWSQSAASGIATLGK